MSDESQNQTAKLAAYTEVCRSYHAVDDFRAKLMALLPFTSGTGGTFLLAQSQGNGNIAAYLGPIGLFGVLVTLGLFFYELRGLDICGKLIKAGENLENELKLDYGQFKSKLEENVIGAEAAGYTVYLSVLLGWIYVAYVGFNKFVC
jgi:hypothetical protein